MSPGPKARVAKRLFRGPARLEMDCVHAWIHIRLCVTIPVGKAVSLRKLMRPHFPPIAHTQATVLHYRRQKKITNHGLSIGAPAETCIRILTLYPGKATDPISASLALADLAQSHVA